jgi:hypothetical protein
VTDLLPRPLDRDSEGALSRLLDVLLDRGVHLDLDLVITVAEVPLIAVNLRATVAGVQTMLDWGVPGVWDELAPRPAPAPRPRPVPPPAEPQGRPVEFHAAMRELRAGGAVWREGTLVLGVDGRIGWRGDGDRRERLRVEPDQLEGVVLEQGSGTSAGRPVVVLRTARGTERLAASRAREILALLTATGDRTTGGRGSG